MARPVIGTCAVSISTDSATPPMRLVAEDEPFQSPVIPRRKARRRLRRVDCGRTRTTTGHTPMQRLRCRGGNGACGNPEGRGCGSAGAVMRGLRYDETWMQALPMHYRGIRVWHVHGDLPGNWREL